MFNSFTLNRDHIIVKFCSQFVNDIVFELDILTISDVKNRRERRIRVLHWSQLWLYPGILYEI